MAGDGAARAWEAVYTSLMPAICRIFFGVEADTMPAPFGAGMRRRHTLPPLPVILVGTVCGLPILFPQ